MRLRSFRTRFIIYIIPLILFVSLSFLVFFINRSTYLIKQGLEELGFSLVRDLAYSSRLAVASEDEILIMPFLQGIFKQKEVILVALYNQNGKIIISQEKIEIEQKMPREVMEELSKEGDVVKRISSTPKGEEIYDFFTPVLIGEVLVPIAQMGEEKIGGFVRVSLSLEEVAVQNRKMFLIGLVITILVILLGLMMSVFLAKRITEPIRQLTKEVEAISRGDFSRRIKIKTGDEIEDLGRTFNQMVEDLQKSQAALEKSKASLEIKVRARTEELKKLTESLEVKIKERTKELQKRLNELERFQRLTIGRELRMIGLKKEIKELKKGR